ncbi:hypothetical protein B0H13DRAFT_1850787 [Mycena leptocephala]|nr:hypothetical protein B0H13DRAFT_1850787 [Mycena leptocephala]
MGLMPANPREPYISENDLQYLLSFPYLVSAEEIQQYCSFCADSTNVKVQSTQGSHAQDNQVDCTKCSLLEAILLAKKLDGDTTRVIKATMTSGVLENPNSLQAHFETSPRGRHGVERSNVNSRLSEVDGDDEILATGSGA